MDFIGILTTFFGIAASASWFIQAWKIHKTKSSKDVSLIMLVIMFLSILMFAIRGLQVDDFAFYLPFIIGLIGNSTAIVMWVKYRK